MLALVMFVDLLLKVAASYAVAGIGFAPLLVWRGLPALDPAAARGTWGFRLLAAPGAALLWPVMLLKWVAARRRAP